MTSKSAASSKNCAHARSLRPYHRANRCRWPKPKKLPTLISTTMDLLIRCRQHRADESVQAPISIVETSSNFWSKTQWIQKLRNKKSSKYLNCRIRVKKIHSNHQSPASIQPQKPTSNPWYRNQCDNPNTLLKSQQALKIIQGLIATTKERVPLLFKYLVLDFRCRVHYFLSAIR